MLKSSFNVIIVFLFPPQKYNYYNHDSFLLYITQISLHLCEIYGILISKCRHYAEVQFQRHYSFSIFFL